MAKRYGSYEAYLEFQRKIGAKGGRVKTVKGYATNLKLASESGKKSKRT